MKQYRKVACMVLAVLSPFAALSSWALVELGSNARRDIERTISAKVAGCLAATEREAARHAAVLQTLGSAMDGDLTHLRLHAEAVFSLMRPDWMTIVLAEGRYQLFNLRLPPGDPLPSTRDPEANERARRAGHPIIDGVAVDRTRLPEPFVTVRTPVIKPGGVVTNYVLIAGVRAWTFNETIRGCGLPAPEWRIGLVDADQHIVARTASDGPHDPYIGQRTSETFREGLASGRLFFESTAIDGRRTFTGIAVSERHGWVASVSVPIVQVEEAVWRVWLFAGSIALAGLLAAAITCWLALRTYARTATTARLEASLREKDTLLREIHHRVKNNIQALWGLMKFECSRLTDPIARERMEVIMQRMLVLGRIHQQLYESESLHRIDFAAHLAELVASVRQTVDPERISLALDTEPLFCDLETALPLGLIVYELISNAQKHAFPGDRKGTITVRLRRMDDGAKVCLGVRDDGAGLNGSRPGIGMVLVDALAAQCDGQVDVVYKDGCRAGVTLPGHLFFDAIAH